jgi:hypothetical protein
MTASKRWQVTCLPLEMKRPFGTQRSISGSFFRTVALAGLFCGGASLLSTSAQEPSDTPSSNEPGDQGPRGMIVVEVTFGRDGKAQDCRVVRSNAPFGLESTTVAQIRKHWGGSFFAGSTAVLPIVFTNAPASNYWNEETASPPDFFPYDNNVYNLTLRVTFGNDGWANEVKVTKPSGISLVDQQTAGWIKAHWYHEAYANKSIEVPFVFKRVQPAAPHPAPKPKAPPPPAEPIAIPAERAQ